MKVLVQHPTGNANVRAAAKGLMEQGLLHSFHTSIAVFPNSVEDRLSKLPMLSELKRREFDAVLQQDTKSWPWNELMRLAATKAGFTSLIEHEKGAFSVDQIYQKFDKHIASFIKNKIANKNNIDAVYAYEDGALSTFQAAKQRQIACLYDLPIGYWKAARNLLQHEHERWPEWASTLTGFKDSEAKLLRKDAELKLADRIFVASSFTADTLKEFDGTLAPIEVIPYGFPPVGPKRSYDYNPSRPLKLLFVGGLSQRKGIADLFAAVDHVGNAVQLTIVGNKTSADCKALDQALAKHTWIPSLPHAAILQIMRAHDVLVFPSLFEGFGLVITEAMSQGTPVITTERTAGPDIIEHNKNGWIIPAGSTAALIEGIKYLLENPDQVASNGLSAKETARLRPWSTYGNQLAQTLI